MLKAPHYERFLIRPIPASACAILLVVIFLASTAPLEMVLHFVPAAAPLMTALWLLLYAFAAAMLFLSHGVNWLSWLVRYRLMLVVLLLGAAVVSAWSVAPGLTINRLTHLIGTTLIAVYIGITLPPNTILKLFGAVLAALMAFSLLALPTLPALSQEYHNGSMVLKGILDNKNTLGFWSATGILLFALLATYEETSPRQFRNRVLYCTAVLLCAVVLVLSQSAGSLLSLTASVGIILFLVIARQFRLSYLPMIILGILMLVLLALIISGINVATLAGRSSDLTGRTEVWEQTWQLIQQRPATGWGYGTLWQPTDESIWIQQQYTDFTWIVYHAHNGLLQLASEIGLPLTAVAVLFIIQQSIEALYCQHKKPSAATLFTVGYLVAFIVSNYSEARFMQSRELFWIWFIALPISVVRYFNATVQSPSIRTDNPLGAENSVGFPTKRAVTIVKNGIGRRARRKRKGQTYEHQPGSTRPTAARNRHSARSNTLRADITKRGARLDTQGTNASPVVAIANAPSASYVSTRGRGASHRGAGESRSKVTGHRALQATRQATRQATQQPNRQPAKRLAKQPGKRRGTHAPSAHNPHQWTASGNTDVTPSSSDAVPPDAQTHPRVANKTQPGKQQKSQRRARQRLRQPTKAVAGKNTGFGSAAADQQTNTKLAEFQERAVATLQHTRVKLQTLYTAAKTQNWTRDWKRDWKRDWQRIAARVRHLDLPALWSKKQ